MEQSEAMSADFQLVLSCTYTRRERQYETTIEKNSAHVFAASADWIKNLII